MTRMRHTPPACSRPAAWLAVCLLAGGGTLPAAEPPSAQDELVVEALLRLDGIDLDAKPKTKQAVLRWLAANVASERFFQLVERFRIAEAADNLARLVRERPRETAGVRSARLLRTLAPARLDDLLASADTDTAAAAITTLGRIGDREALDRLAALVVDQARPLPVRSAATAALAASPPGGRRLLEIVRQGDLPADLRVAAASGLLGSADPAIRTAAAEHLEMPAGVDARPLPPLPELMAMRADAGRGRQLFATTGTCGKCHVVGGEGRAVGPDLSGIGTKLSREALFASILDPSAAISHNYETFTAVTTDGRAISGLLADRTAERIVLKDAEGILHPLRPADVEELVKQPVSLMPADLQKLLTAQDLVDVVAWLETLRAP